MVTVNAKIDSITVSPDETPKDVGSVPGPDTAAVVVSFEAPHSGGFTVNLPASAIGGLAAGRCRVMLDEA